MAEDLGKVYFTITADTSGLTEAEQAMLRVAGTANQVGRSASILGTEIESAGRKGKPATEALASGFDKTTSAAVKAGAASGAVGEGLTSAGIKGKKAADEIAAGLEKSSNAVARTERSARNLSDELDTTGRKGKAAGDSAGAGMEKAAASTVKAAKNAQSAGEEVETAGRKGKVAGDAVSGGMEKSASSTNRARNSAHQMGEELEDAGKKGKKATDEIEGGVTQVTDAVRLANRAFAVLGISLGVHEAIEYSDAWKQVNNQIRQVTDNEGELGAVRSQLISISRDTNSELETTVGLYSEMFRATRDLGTEQSTVAQVTKTINNLFKAGGKEASETAGAVRQLTQGLAAGALRGDEFNSVAEGAPRILDALAQHLGMARGELREFAATGGITAQILIEALSSYSGEAQRLADMTELTFGQKMETARTNLIALSEEAGVVHSAINVLGDGILGVSENLGLLINLTEAGAVVMAGRLSVSLGKATVEAYKKAAASAAAAVAEKGAALADLQAAEAANAHAIADLRAAQAAASRTPGFYLNSAALKALAIAEVEATSAAAALTAAQERAMVATRAASALSRGLSGAMALLGGPAGVVTLAAGALYLWWQHAQDANQPTLNLSQSVDSLAASYRELGLAQREIARIELESSIVDVTQRIAAAERALSEARAQQVNQLGTWEGAEERRLENIRNAQAAVEALRSEEAKYIEVRASYLAMDDLIKQEQIDAFLKYNGWVANVTNSTEAFNEKVQAQIDKLAVQRATLHMTERAAAIFEARLEAINKGASPEAVTLAGDMAAALFDEKKALEEAAKAADGFNEKVQDQIAELAKQQAMQHMSERAAAIFEARLRAINSGAGPQAVKLAGDMAAAYYDQAEAVEKAAQEAERARDRINDTAASVREAQEAAAKAVEKAHKDATREAIEDYREMRDDIGDAFADMVMSGQSAADILKNTFKRTAAEIAGDFLAAMTLDFLGGNPTGKGFSLAGSIANAGTAGKIIMAGAKKFLPGLFSGSASTAGVLSAADYVAVMEASGAKFGTAAGAAGAGGSTGLLGGLGRAIGSIPPWGWALAGGAVLASMFDKKSTPSYNAGLLLHDLPTLEADRKFAVAPFESGLTPVGFNRRTTQEEADQVVEYFRQIDSLIVNTAKTFDKIVSADLVRGLDERGLGSGIFLGAAREDGLATTPVDQQGVMFARQLIESLRGQIEDADLGKILAETTVEGMVATLQKVLQGSMSPAELAFKQYVKDRLEFFGGATTGALKDIERKAKDFGFTLEDVARITGYSADRVTEAFARINSSLGSAASAASSAAQAMATSLSNIKDYISQAVSASDALIREQIRQRETYYRELMRQEEQLHNRRLRLFQSLQAYTSSLRTGDMTILSPTEQLEAARSEFQSLASVVTNTSLSQEVRLKAAEQLQSAADTYLREGRDYYASSGGYKEIFDEVMQALEAAKFLGTNQEYDGSALENQMLEELQKMNAQLGSLPQGIGAVLGPMLASLIGQALAAGHDARYTANTIASLGPEAVEAGNKPFQQAYGKTIEEAATTPEQAKIALEEIKALGMNEVDTIKFIVEKAKSVGLSSDRVGELLGLTPEQVAKNLAIAGIPAFAKGGRHKGGLALVGEEGPELVDLGPSTIYTASDTQRILSVVQEIANTALGKNTRVAAVELLTKRDPEALLQATAQAQDGGLLMERTADLLRLVSELKGSGATVVDIPAFAKGGYHTGGLALVGEEGPELVRMGPSQVFTAHETREILRGSSDRMGGLATEELMREVIIELRQVKDMLHRLLNAEIAGGSAAAQQREAQIKKLDDIGRKLQPVIGGSRKYVG